MTTRRKFIKKTSVLGAGILVTPAISPNFFGNFESQKLNVGLIGVGERGNFYLYEHSGKD